jgi:thiamine monophosphate kinase
MTAPLPNVPVRLTTLCRGGGCGIETADDAAVYRLNDEQALIATTDRILAGGHSV